MMADKEEQRQKERMRHLNGIENEDDLYSEGDSIANAAGSSETPADATNEPEEERVRLSLRTADSKKMPFRVKPVSGRCVMLSGRVRTDTGKNMSRRRHCKSW